jgi:hypothetical protein
MRVEKRQLQLGVLFIDKGINVTQKLSYIKNVFKKEN